MNTKVILLLQIILFLVAFAATSFVSHKLPKSLERNIKTNLPLSLTVSISGKRHNITTQVTKRLIEKRNRKHYEIINMLWRKTKIFVDVETNTSKYQSRRQNWTELPVFTAQSFRKENMQVHRSLPGVETSRPSFIEFYYMHEIDDSSNERGYSNSNYPIDVKTKGDEIRRTTLGTVKVFYFFDPLYRTPKPTSFKSFKTFNRTRSNNKISSLRNGTTLSKLNSHRFLRRNTILSSATKCTKTVFTNLFRDKYKVNIFSNVLNTTSKVISTNATKTTDLKKNTDISDENSVVNETTINDRVRFFEIYDNQQPLQLENVDFGIVPNNTTVKLKQRKKHITETKPIKTEIEESQKIDQTSTKPIKINSKQINNLPLRTNTIYSFELISWLVYPFVAVYNYEPLQVHCDAASISPHWLVASASCLSRHHTNSGGYGQSAFVAYCGDRWWQPERIAYVKYSLIHPKFRPWDKTRRRLYNIGLIRVISSMTSSCSDWAPISLMSHQFHTNLNGSKAIAIGWGLDRYDSKYSFINLPKRTPSVYEALLYSNDCPGNMEYSTLKNNYRDTSINNIYCLSLPQYLGEENDPQHGSLLLVDGKLIGLYLQEERRGRGEQSAQYTGTWRLVPWVLDVAREPDEADVFTVDV